MQAPATAPGKLPGNNRHLDSAYRYLADAWLPANPELLARIRHGLKSGRYAGDFELLLRDVKRDVALFTYCLKQIAAQRADRGETADLDPVNGLREAGIDGLRSILESTPGGRHSFASASDTQLLQLRGAMVSATVAETVAAPAGVSAEAAYSSSVLRQLGLALIAWNYPHIYERVFDLIEPSESVDLTLTKMLGFSPTLLGYRIAQEWRIVPEIRAAIGDKHAFDGAVEDPSAQASAVALRKICEVGEALARANEPTRYPTAAQDWDASKREILRYLGRAGFQELSQKLQESCRYYEIAFPKIFSDLGALTPANIAQATETTVGLVNNLHAKYCTERVQGLLTDLYTKLDVKTVSRDCIEFLVTDVVAEAGFERGCVYIMDPDTQTLVPRLAVGSARLGEFKSIRFSSSQIDNPILTAYRSSSPVSNTSEEASAEPNPIPTYIAGVLGKVQRAGVLYLELGEQNRTAADRNWVAWFKAVKKSLEDCLNLQ